MKKVSLILLGFLLFVLYFWLRFLRLRISKPLPFEELSVFSFFTILYICWIFFYILKSLLFTQRSSLQLEQIIEWMFTPIMEFDKYLKSISLLKTFYDKLLAHLIPYLRYMIIDTNYFFKIFWLYPRMILLTALFLDVMWFRQFHYKYLVITIGILLFLNRYIKHSLRTTKQDLLTYYSQYISKVCTGYVPLVLPYEKERLAEDENYNPYEDDEDDEDGEGYVPITTMLLSFEDYIEFATESEVYQNIIREKDRRFCISTRKADDEFWEKHIKQPYRNFRIGFGGEVPKDYTNIFGDQVPSNYYKAYELVEKELDKSEDEAIKKTMDISLIVAYYSKTSTEEIVKYLKILIYTNYLICWLYVLIISIQNLELEDMIIMLNQSWVKISMPF